MYLSVQQSHLTVTARTRDVPLRDVVRDMTSGPPGHEVAEDFTVIAPTSLAVQLSSSL